jgi:hypothetical protein
MNTITVRNMPPAVARAIREKAKKERISLNRAVISLLEEATGIGQPKKKEVLHHDLDRFAGCWTQEEYDEFMEALREQRQSPA